MIKKPNTDIIIKFLRIQKRLPNYSNKNDILLIKKLERKYKLKKIKLRILKD